jgi:hypothetical protein
MIPALLAADFDPQIVFEPAQDMEFPDVSSLVPRLLAEQFRIVYLQKVRRPGVVRLARRLSAAGVNTVYGVCDRVDIQMAEATDATIAVTEYLKSLYPERLWPKMHVVHDGIEQPEARKSNWTENRGSPCRPLSAVLVTSQDLGRLPVLRAPPDWLKVTIVGRYPPAWQTSQRLRQARLNLCALRDSRGRGHYLRFLANRRIRCVGWDPIGVYGILRQADIGIIPIEGSREPENGLQPPAWQLKSENRLTMKMCAGLPVVVTPIPAYESVIEHERNGFLARSLQERLECLDELRDPARRRIVGERARESVLQRYSMGEQGRRLIGVLHGLMSGSR